LRQELKESCCSFSSISNSSQKYLHPAKKDRNQNVSTDFFHPATLLDFKAQINTEILLFFFSSEKEKIMQMATTYIPHIAKNRKAHCILLSGLRFINAGLHAYGPSGP